MKLAFIGIGNVGLALAQNLEQQGHEITVAHDDPQSSSVQEALQKNPGFKVRPVQEAVNEAEVTFLAIPFKANEGKQNFRSRTGAKMGSGCACGEGLYHLWL